MVTLADTPTRNEPWLWIHHQPAIDGALFGICGRRNRSLPELAVIATELTCEAPTERVAVANSGPLVTELLELVQQSRERFVAPGVRGIRELPGEAKRGREFGDAIIESDAFGIVVSRGRFELAPT